jgi:hypothetical protein
VISGRTRSEVLQTLEESVPSEVLRSAIPGLPRPWVCLVGITIMIRNYVIIIDAFIIGFRCLCYYIINALLLTIKERGQYADMYWRQSRRGVGRRCRGRGAEVAVQRRSGEGALQRNQQKKTNRSCTQVG